MTLEELSEAKEKAQTEIMEALNRFMKSTGLTVGHVTFDKLEYQNFDQTRAQCIATAVRLDVRL